MEEQEVSEIVLLTLTDIIIQSLAKKLKFKLISISIYRDKNT